MLAEAHPQSLEAARLEKKCPAGAQLAKALGLERLVELFFEKKI